MKKRAKKTTKIDKKMNKFLMILIFGSAFSAVSTEAALNSNDFITLDPCHDALGKDYANMIAVKIRNICAQAIEESWSWGKLLESRSSKHTKGIKRYMMNH